MPVTIRDVNRIPQILEALPEYLDEVYQRSLARVHWWVSEIFRTQGPTDVQDPVTEDIYQRWPDLQERTIRLKGGERVILIDTGTLLSSIVMVDVERGPAYYEGRVGIFVGPALDYARVHEFGGVIRLRVTQKMRNFFLAMFLEEKREDPDKDLDEYMYRPLRRDTTEITVRIPQRSYLRQGQIRATEDVLSLVVTVLEGVLRGILT